MWKNEIIHILKKITLLFIFFAIPTFSFAYEAGDILTFGSYPYDYEEKGGKTINKPIEWYILNKYEDGTALIMSKYVLDVSTYNVRGVDTSWEKSTIHTQNPFLRAVRDPPGGE